MASDIEKRDASFKHTLDVHHTRTDKQWFEETYQTRHVTVAPQVWAKTPVYNDRDASVLAGLAVHEVSFELTMDPFSDGRLWVAKENPGVWPFTGFLTDFTTLNTERVKHWINPFAFGPSTTTGYTYSLLQGNGAQIPDGNWEVNFAEGLIHLDNGYTAADQGWILPLRLTAYRYIGGFVVSINDFNKMWVGFNYGDVPSGSKLIGTIDQNRFVSKVVIQIEESFDDSTLVTVGDDVAQGRLLVYADTAPDMVDDYETTPNAFYNTPTPIKLYFSSSAPTMGQGLVIVYFS